MTHHARLVTLSLAAGLAATAHCTLAGDLYPPAGPVAPTAKPLAEVEPRIAINATNTPGDANSLYRVNQPGSYYLSGDVTGVSGRHGIEIGADDVSIDLMGFTLRGVDDSLDGLSADGGSRNNIRVENGIIRDWDGLGVQLHSGANQHISAVHAVDNAGIGILCGTTAIIQSCTASNNGSDGIACSSGALVSMCGVRENGGFGISVDTGSTVTGCQTMSNGASGVMAVFSTVSNCTSAFNLANGVSASACTVIACTTSANSGNGISVSGGCLVLQNTCRSNGSGGGSGAGIYADGIDNRIERNTCTFNNRGIGVGVPGNIIVSNSCSGNTINWEIAANNVFGPIIDRTVPGSGAVSGNSAASTLGSTDPNANFTY